MSDFKTGHYWYGSDDGCGELDLGICKTQAELDAVIAEMQAAGDDSLDWSDWSASLVSDD